MKATKHTRLHSVGFHLYETPSTGKSRDKKQISGRQGLEEGAGEAGRNCETAQGFRRVMSMNQIDALAARCTMVNVMLHTFYPNKIFKKRDRAIYRHRN